MRICSIVALALCSAAAVGSYAQAQGDPKLNSIVQPIVPDAKIGLPDKAPSIEQVVIPKRPAQPERQAGSAKEASASEWKVECLEKGVPQPKCQVIVRALAGNQIALVLGIAKTLSAPNAKMQMAVPLGLAVQKGVTIKLGEYSADFPVSRCTAQGCLVEGDAPDSLVGALKKSIDGVVVIYTTDGNPIQLPLPSKGFDRLFASLVASD